MGPVTLALTGMVKAVMRLRYAARLAGEVVLYAKVNRAWWILPLMGLLVVIMAVVVVGQAAAPWTMYTLF